MLHTVILDCHFLHTPALSRKAGVRKLVFQWQMMCRPLYLLPSVVEDGCTRTESEAGRLSLDIAKCSTSSLPYKKKRPSVAQASGLLTFFLDEIPAPSGGSMGISDLVPNMMLLAPCRRAAHKQTLAARPCSPCFVGTGATPLVRTPIGLRRAAKTAILEPNNHIRAGRAWMAR